MAMPTKEAMLQMVEVLRKAQEDGSLYKNIARNNPLFEMLKTKAEAETSLANYKARIEKELAERVAKKKAEAREEIERGKADQYRQMLFGSAPTDYSKLGAGIMNMGGPIGAGLAQRNVAKQDYIEGTWTEIWSTVLDSRMTELVASGNGRPSIGYFDAWAKKAAQAKGLALLGTSDFAVNYMVNSDAYEMRAKVLLTKWTPEQQGAQGMVPYIDEVTIKTNPTIARRDGWIPVNPELDKAIEEAMETSPVPTKTSRFAELDFEEYPKGGKK